MNPQQNPVPVRARLALVDPESMTVVWANEAALEMLSDDALPAGATIEQIVPMAAAMGVAEALVEVASTGVPRHFQADLVSTGRGNVAMVTSVYRLPDGSLLVATENAWQWTPRDPGESRPRSGRRGR